MSITLSYSPRLLPVQVGRWCRRQDSNPRQADYRSAVLPLNYTGMARREGVEPSTRGLGYYRPRSAETGAGGGNRTRIISLEGCCSTIELHPLGCWRIRADKKLQPLGLRRYGAPSSYASQCAPFHLPRCVLRIHQQSLTPGMSSRPSGPAQEAKLCWSSALTRRRLGRFMRSA